MYEAYRHRNLKAIPHGIKSHLCLYTCFDTIVSLVLKCKHPYSYKYKISGCIKTGFQLITVLLNMYICLI